MIVVSIIIPTQNRSKQLKGLLLSIEENNPSSAFETIIIDNGSTDDTKEISLSFQNRIENLSYHYKSEPGLLTGRHAGAELAKGEILCFLDDDVKLNPNYLAAVLNAFITDTSLHLATGPCLPNYEIPPPNWLTYFWDERPEGKFCTWLSLIDFGNNCIEIHPNFVWGLNFCIRKEALFALGGFHPDSVPSQYQQFQGDGETGLTLKAAENGCKAIYHPALAVRHEVSQKRLTLEYFQKRAYFQGICNSFSDLRYAHFNKEEKLVETKKTIKDKLHPYYRWIKLFLPTKEPRKPRAVKVMLKNLTDCEQEGYRFHQSQFHNNVKVKHWVLKENYWDYKLP